MKACPVELDTYAHNEAGPELDWLVSSQRAASRLEAFLRADLRHELITDSELDKLVNDLRDYYADSVYTAIRDSADQLRERDE